MLGGIILVKHLPINGEQIVCDGKEMIARHGDSALVQVDEQISSCESEGFESVAETWKLIREVIRQIQQSDRTTEGYKQALNKGVFLSE